MRCRVVLSSWVSEVIGNAESALTCIRERTTWYGYVDVRALSLAAADIIVYEALDCGRY